GRPRPLSARRERRVPGPAGRAGEGARLPDRARRDRGPPAGASGPGGGGGRGAGDGDRRPAAGRPRRAPRRRHAAGRGAAPAPAGPRRGRRAADVRDPAVLPPRDGGGGPRGVRGTLKCFLASWSATRLSSSSPPNHLARGGRAPPGDGGRPSV